MNVPKRLQAVTLAGMALVMLAAVVGLIGAEPNVTPTVSGGGPRTDRPSVEQTATPPAAIALRKSAAADRASGTDLPLEPDLATTAITGFVRDPTGLGVENATILAVRAAGTSPLGTSGPGGRFWVSIPTDAQALSASRPEWLAVRTARLATSQSSYQHLIIMAPAGPLHGQVSGRAAGALEGAAVAVETSVERWPDARRIIDSTSVVHWQTQTNSRGQFAFGAVPRGPHFAVTARAERHQPATLALRAQSTSSVQLVLESFHASGRWIEGIVTNSEGRPTNVSIGGATIACDPTGRFLLRCPDATHATSDLVAFAAGQQPAVLENFGARLPPPGQTGTVGPVLLSLGPPTLSARGQLVDRAGAAQKGWRLQLVRAVDGSPTDLEQSLGSQDRAHWTARTDAEGQFAFDGLLPVRYRIIAIRGRRQAALEFTPTVSDPIPLRLEVDRSTL